MARLLTGQGTFVDDVTRPGMLPACFVRSPFARATINSIDTSAALAMPGVLAVFTAEDLNADAVESWHAVAGKDIQDIRRPPLAEGEGKFVGDPRRARRRRIPLPRAKTPRTRSRSTTSCSLADLLVGGLRVVTQQSGDGRDETRCAEVAETM